MEHLVQDQCAKMNNDLVVENIFLKGLPLILNQILEE